MINFGQMVLQGVNWVHNDGNQGHVVLKAVIWVHND